MTPIITTILSNISKKLDTLIENKDRTINLENFNSSKCLVCDGDNLSITYTAKRKKGYNYRIATCLDCGSSNKQIVMTVSANKNPTLLTLKDWKLKFFFKPHSIIVKDNIVSLGKDWANSSFKKHINKNNIWKKFGFKEIESWINIWKKIVEGTGRNLIQQQFQKNYDDGIFKVAKNCIDPVEVRFKHTFKKNTIIAKAHKILWSGSNKGDIHLYACASCRWRQVNEDTELYYFEFKKAAINREE